MRMREINEMSGETVINIGLARPEIVGALTLYPFTYLKHKAGGGITLSRSITLGSGQVIRVTCSVLESLVSVYLLTPTVNRDEVRVMPIIRDVELGVFVAAYPDEGKLITLVCREVEQAWMERHKEDAR